VLFAAIPGFKPCTAIIIIAGIYFGRQQGFTVGALTALISNIYYGQGMWTPFQMTVWGLTGFFSGIFSKALQKSKPLLIIFGIISGVAFSLIMDLWSCLWADKTVILSRYLTLITTSAPFTLTYALSNTVFLLLFNKPARRIFTRIKKKFFI
jgi:energy-coupling factor transport system substrate-specific component